MGDAAGRRQLHRIAVLGQSGVSELAVPYQMSLQAVSKHLKVLEDAGLVSRSRDAQRRPVHLEADRLAELTTWIDHYHRVAEQRYSRLEHVLRELTETTDTTT